MTEKIENKENAIKTLTLIEEVGNTSWEANAGSYIQFLGRRRMIQGQLMVDYEKQGDGIFWVMQRTSVVKSSYSMADLWKNKMFNEAPVLEDGEIVTIQYAKMYEDHIDPISKKQYRFKINGDYSDCAIFEEVA